MTKVTVLLVVLFLKYSATDLRSFSLHWSCTDKWVQKDFTTVFDQAAPKTCMT